MRGDNVVQAAGVGAEVCVAPIREVDLPGMEGQRMKRGGGEKARKHQVLLDMGGRLIDDTFSYELRVTDNQ